MTTCNVRCRLLFSQELEETKAAKRRVNIGLQSSVCCPETRLQINANVQLYLLAVSMLCIKFVVLPPSGQKISFFLNVYFLERNLGCICLFRSEAMSGILSHTVIKKHKFTDPVVTSPN